MKVLHRRARSRKLKYGGVALAGVLTVVVAAAALLIAQIDSIVESAVETYGSEMIRSRVTLDRVEISPTSGRATLAGLVVANPAGFQNDNAFALGRVSVDFDVSTVTGEAIVINRILVDAPEITFEVGPGGSNMEVLLRNAEAYGGRPVAGEPVAGRALAGRTGPRFIVDELVIQSAKVSIVANLIAAQKVTTAIPDIHLSGLGRSQGGVPPGVIVRRVLEAVGKSASDAALTGGSMGEFRMPPSGR